MDGMETVVLLLNYFQMLWKSFVTTSYSGTAMGVLLAQMVGVFLLIWVVHLIYKAFTYKRRKVDKQVHEFKQLIKGRLMSAKKEHEQLDILAQDAITDIFETYYAQAKITLEQKDYIYEKIAKACEWEELLTFAKASKKEQIKRKLDPRSKNYLYKPVKLPEAGSRMASKVMKWASGRVFKKA